MDLLGISPGLGAKPLPRGITSPTDYIA